MVMVTVGVFRTELAIRRTASVRCVLSVVITTKLLAYPTRSLPLSTNGEVAMWGPVRSPLS